jgi:acyl carrier protein
MSRPQTADESDMAALIVSALNLEDVAPGDIDPDAPLFGTGLGLDSIDALELSIEIAKRHGVQLRSDDQDNRKIFASLASLTAHVVAQRPA